jgi:hypothetical protein
MDDERCRESRCYKAIRSDIVRASLTWRSFEAANVRLHASQQAIGHHRHGWVLT